MTTSLRFDYVDNELLDWASFEIRDVDDRLVHRGPVGDQGVLVDPGIYSVRTVLSNGHRADTVVVAREHQTSEVTFPRAQRPSRGRDDPAWDRPVHSWEPELEVLHTEGCFTTPAKQGFEIRAAFDGIINEAPSVSISFDGIVWQVSVPVYEDNWLSRSCSLSVYRQSHTPIPRFELHVPREREWLGRLLAMIRNNTLSSGTEFLTAATLSLQAKRSDPIAATLGGLILHRFGRLQDHESWAHNLGTWFKELPDAEILYAATLFDSTDETRVLEGAHILVDAVERRPIFTESLSLAVRLLNDARRNRILKQSMQDDLELAARTADISSSASDWSQLLFVTRR